MVNLFIELARHAGFKCMKIRGYDKLGGYNIGENFTGTFGCLPSLDCCCSFLQQLCCSQGLASVCSFASAHAQCFALTHDDILTVPFRCMVRSCDARVAGGVGARSGPMVTDRPALLSLRGAIGTRAQGASILRL